MSWPVLPCPALSCRQAPSCPILSCSNPIMLYCVILYTPIHNDDQYSQHVVNRNQSDESMTIDISTIRSLYGSLNISYGIKAHDNNYHNF